MTASAGTGAPSKRHDKVEILIVGAGVGGLSAAYAIRRSQAYNEGLIDLRIVEKRARHSAEAEAGYPIHLSSSGRQALISLLTPDDLLLLSEARSEIPVLHDGLTVSSYTGKQVYRLVRDSGCKPMVERKRLLDILRRGAGEVEYGVEMEDVRQDQPGKIKVSFGDGSESVVHLVIGADGMFSPIRRSIPISHSGHSPSKKGEIVDKQSPDEITKMGYTTINLRTTSNGVLKWIKDPSGVNMIYGDSFSATIIPLSSAKLSTTSEPVATPTPTLNETSPDLASALTRAEAAYVALTVPSKWLEPSYAARMESCDCPQTIAGAFLRDLEHSDGWPTRRGFELWSMSRTNAGKGRLVLIGDAAHGMVPFCGAGASSAIVDAVQLVNVLDLAMRAKDNEHTLDLALNEYRSQSKARNDPLIAQSMRLLWLAQGDGEVARLARRVVFWGLEMREKFSRERKRSEKELDCLMGAKWIEQPPYIIEE
ncbi:hypothetical protein IAT40_001938 [Kwoniella sp. CBS 6097]